MNIGGGHGRFGVIVAAGLAIMALAGPSPAAADAGSFLLSIEGAWKGRGTARIPGRENEERISCKVDNRYEEKSAALEITGNCATTQSKSSVSGRLSHSGDEVTGSLMGTFEGATITRSSGKLSGNRLVVSTNFLDNATGNLTRSRQVIRKTGSGFEAEFYTYSNKQRKFVKAGSIAFSAN